MSDVHFVLPAGIDDPSRPSGGNSYDRRISDELVGRGWTVQEHPVDGIWPAADAASRCALGEMIRDLPEGTLVLIDGLIGSAAPEILGPAAHRLRLVLLVHMPLED